MSGRMTLDEMMVLGVKGVHVPTDPGPTDESVMPFGRALNGTPREGEVVLVEVKRYGWASEAGEVHLCETLEKAHEAARDYIEDWQLEPREVARIMVGEAVQRELTPGDALPVEDIAESLRAEREDVGREPDADSWINAVHEWYGEKLEEPDWPGVPGCREAYAALGPIPTAEAIHGWLLEWVYTEHYWEIVPVKSEETK